MKVSELIKILKKCNPDFEMDISVDVSDEEFLEIIEDRNDHIVKLLCTGTLNF